MDSVLIIEKEFMYHGNFYFLKDKSLSQLNNQGKGIIMSRQRKVL